MKTVLLFALVAAIFLSCPDKDEYCIACNGTQCLECAAAYLDNNGKCVAPKNTIDNCAQYKSEGVCAYCIPGYYTTTEGKCAKIKIEGCAELASATKCGMCFNGILAKNGTCNKDNQCSIENCGMCASRSTSEACSRCKTGYVVLIADGKYTCKEESGDNHNCLYLNSNNPALCAVCDYNFYMKNHKCEKSSKYSLAISGTELVSIVTSLLMFFLFK